MSRRLENGECKKQVLSYKMAKKVVAKAKIYRKMELSVYKCNNCAKYHVTGQIGDKHHYIRRA